MARHNFISDLINVIADAKLIKRGDEETRKKSKRFGIMAIIFAIFAVPLSAGAAFLISIMSGGGSAMLLFIFIIAGILVCAGGALLMLLNALVRIIAQLTINRGAISWIALIVFILSIAGCALMFGMFA